jgi:hypothetical protein
VKSDFHEEVRLGATSQDVLDEYLLDLKKRGVGEYHIRGVEHYVGGCVREFPSLFYQQANANQLSTIMSP